MNILTTDILSILHSKYGRCMACKKIGCGHTSTTLDDFIKIDIDWLIEEIEKLSDKYEHSKS